jgi:Flp pilus assembly protein TadG
LSIAADQVTQQMETSGPTERTHPSRHLRCFASRLRREDGQALVEFALVLPILLLVLLGIVDFSRATNYWDDATHLANLGARVAAVGAIPSDDCSGSGSVAAYVKCRAQKDYPGEFYNTATVCVTQPGSATLAPGSPVKVTVNATFNWMPYLRFLGASTQLSGSATMRLETVNSNVSVLGCA